MANLTNVASTIPRNCDPFRKDYDMIIVQIPIIVITYWTSYILLKPLGQPRAVSQLLAGVILGKSGFSKIKFFREKIFPDLSNGPVNTIMSVGRTFFMFLAGLEIDFQYMKQSRYRAAAVAGGGIAACSFLAIIFSKWLHLLLHTHDPFWAFIFFIMITFTNTASPFLIRMTTDLKLATMEVGRVAIAAALINDTLCLLGVAETDMLLMLAKERKIQVLVAPASFAIVAAAAFSIRWLAKWLNGHNKLQRELKYHEITSILVFVGVISLLVQRLSHSSMLASLVLGAVMPREGKVVRTLTHKVGHPMNRQFLPFYFAFLGYHANLSLLLGSGRLIAAAFLIILFSTAGKVLGTAMAAHYYGMRLYEGVLMGFLLSVRGHMEFFILREAKLGGILDEKDYQAMVTTAILCTLILSPAVTIIMRRERRSRPYNTNSFEGQRPDSDVRILACTHRPRDLPTMLKLLELSKGTNRSPLIAYVLHLIEHTPAFTTRLFYHQKEEFEEFACGQNDPIDINNMIDGWIREGSISIRQFTAVSESTNMFLDVLRRADYVDAVMVLLPFHKYDRLDAVNRGIRLTNQKVLARATCTVGILVDRGFGGVWMGKLSAVQSPVHVAVLFFGGTDDREALGYGGRLAQHPNVSVTVVRFTSNLSKDCETVVGMKCAAEDGVILFTNDYEKQKDADEAFLAKFYNSYVVTGLVSYTERFVETGAETVKELSAMESMFSLFIVGKGGRGLSPLTTGISQWEEFPELGVIGDLLASSHFKQSGSVLVVQQYCPFKQDQT